MGFELYLQCYAGGNPAGVSRAEVRALFPIVDEESEANYWQVRYDGTNSCTIGVDVLKGDAAKIQSLCVYRPCGDALFLEAILALLRMGSVMLVFPGCSAPLVASASVVADLPEDVVESMGQPKLVRSARELLEIIRAS